MERRQQAKLYELSPAVSFAKLSHGQANRLEAHELLGPIYNWFTEGFDTKDHNDEKALLDELS